MGFDITKPGVSDRGATLYKKIFERFGIDLLVDVGANEGQYVRRTRTWGYQGEIISFEPIKSVFKVLDAKTNLDEKWQAINCALSDESKQAVINVSENTVSSSLLEMNEEHLKNEPSSRYVREEEITIKRLDEVEELISRNIQNGYLKVDVQGLERNVVNGAGDLLDRFSVVEMESALRPLYKGEPDLREMILFMEERGFIVYNMFPAFLNFDTGQLLQVDCIFAQAKMV